MATMRDAIAGAVPARAQGDRQRVATIVADARGAGQAAGMRARRVEATLRVPIAVVAIAVADGPMDVAMRAVRGQRGAMVRPVRGVASRLLIVGRPSLPMAHVVAVMAIVVGPSAAIVPRLRAPEIDPRARPLTPSAGSTVCSTSRASAA